QRRTERDTDPGGIDRGRRVGDGRDGSIADHRIPLRARDARRRASTGDRTRRTPGMMTADELAIARSVVYASLFDYPLTLDELHRTLVERDLSPSQIA